MTFKNGTEIEPRYDRDESRLGIEKISGVNLQTRQRLQINFQILRDSLFENLTKDYYIVPLTFISREAIMSKEKANLILGDLYIAMSAKKVGTIIIVFLGLSIVSFGLYLFYQYRIADMKEIREQRRARKRKNQFKINFTVQES